jgi:hypothetical protein
MIGQPIFDYPAERRAPEGEGCETCGIVLEADAIGNYCSPECCEWPDRCLGCDRGQTWCTCECTHCLDCGNALSTRDVERQLRTCRACADGRLLVRHDLGPFSRLRPQRDASKGDA